jgi:hypothetical protein
MSGHSYVRAGGAAALALGGLVCVLAAQPRDTASLVCITPDGVMHAASGGKCAANQTAVPLASPVAGACTSDPWSGATDCDPSPPDADDRLGVLDARVRTLEQRPRFEVVGKDSRPIFQVTPGKAVVSTSSGDRVVEMRAREAGGDVIARNANGAEVALSVSGALGGLVMTENGVRRVEFGKQAAGNVSLRFLHGPGIVAAIGESQANTGALVVADPMGTPRARMSLDDGKGSLSILNGQGTPVLGMTEGATGGGLLVIGDASGTPMVKFGVNDNRYGVVLAGPVSGFPLVPNSGLEASYFLGCAGGDKCGPGGGGSR